MRFRVLGAVEVHTARGYAPVTGTIQQRLLATLLVRRNHTTPVDTLIAAVWGDSQHVARNTLQVHIGQLRKVLRTGATEPFSELHGSRAGYRLDVESGDIDVDAFEQLCVVAAARASEPSRAVAVLERAMNLWRGKPFEGIDGIGLIEQETARLVDRHAAAGDQLLQMLLATDRVDDVIAAAPPMLEQHPYREPLITSYALALYRSGRAGDGLAALREFARRLDADLGITVTPQLHRLQQDLLRHGTSAPRAEAPEPAPMAWLPWRSASFVGRHGEVNQIAALLGKTTADRSRIVSIVGPGGVGKTRLALAVADTVADVFDAVVHVSLAEVHTVELAKVDILMALGASGQPTTSSILMPSLQEKSVLLVLDNLEHLLELAPHVLALIQQSPRLTVLLTSRAPLTVRGEHEFELRPLGLPVNVGDEAPALSLLIERAAGVDLRDPAAQDALVEICRRCDGLPLAIELAAGRLRVMSPQTLATSLADPLSVLGGGGAALPNRQRTLRNVLDWSNDLLGSHEQMLLSQLSIFAGGATFNDAASVCEVPPDASFTDLLVSLVAQHLVMVDQGPAGQRVRMLETVREYARERMTGTATQRLALRHARHYLSAVARARPHVAAMVPASDVARLVAEHANLRAALDVADRSPTDKPLAAAALVGAWGLWFAAGHISEGRSWVARFRSRVTGRQHAELSTLEGALALYQADFDAAMAALDDALPWFVSEDVHDWAARVCEARSTIYLLRGDIAAARSTATEGLRHAQLSQDGLVLGRAHFLAGSLAVGTGNLAGGQASFHAYLAASERVVSHRDIAVAHANLAAVTTLQGNLTSAEMHAAASLQAVEHAASDPDLAFVLEMDALVALAGGRFAASERRYRQALSIGRDAGHRYRVDRLLAGLAAALAASAPTQAIRVAAMADLWRERHGGTATWPALLVFYAEPLTAARAMLGESEVAAATSSGRMATDRELDAEAVAFDALRPSGSRR